MKVIAAVNGQVTSELAALYALRYASVHDYTLTLLHIVSPEDNIDDVEKSMLVIEERSEKFGVKIEREYLNGDPVKAIQDFLSKANVDTLFCSTRPHKRFFETSFSEKLVRVRLPINLAIIRIANINMAYGVRTAVLPIRKDRLAVSKFSFFSSLAKAYNASAEIYSITLLSKRKMSKLTVATIKTLLSDINLNLSHYSRLSHLMNIPLRIKHAIAENEVDQILYQLSHCDYQMMVIDGERLTSFSLLFAKHPIERLFRYTPVNIIAFYSRGKE